MSVYLNPWFRPSEKKSDYQPSPDKSLLPGRISGSTETVLPVLKIDTVKSTRNKHFIFQSDGIK